MTDEQIKQNAEEYILPLKVLPDVDDKITFIAAIREAFIAGAHSRDEEIEDLKNEASAIMDEASALKIQLDKLRNPWISVEDRLPDEFQKVIVMFDSGIIIDAFMTLVKDEPAWHPSVEIPIGSDVIFWMPKPELKKGE